MSSSWWNNPSIKHVFVLSWLCIAMTLLVSLIGFIFFAVRYPRVETSVSFQKTRSPHTRFSPKTNCHTFFWCGEKENPSIEFKSNTQRKTKLTKMLHDAIFFRFSSSDFYIYLSIYLSIYIYYRRRNLPCVCCLDGRMEF